MTNEHWSRNITPDERAYQRKQKRDDFIITAFIATWVFGPPLAAIIAIAYKQF